MDKKPTANNEDAILRVVIRRPSETFMPVPPEVLEDPNLIIAAPERTRRSFVGPLPKRIPNNLTTDQKIVRRGLMAGRACLEYGGKVPFRVRDDLFALARAGDGAALAVARWLLRRRLVPLSVLVSDQDNLPDGGGDHDR
jgi:hypothetical protein